MRHTDWSGDIGAINDTIAALGQRALRNSGGDWVRSEALFERYLYLAESRLNRVGSAYSVELQPAAIAGGERVPNFIWMHIIASATTRSVIEGNSFGDNILASLPNAIASMLGRQIDRSAPGNAISGTKKGAQAGGRQTGRHSLGSSLANSGTNGKTTGQQIEEAVQDEIIVVTAHRSNPYQSGISISQMSADLDRFVAEYNAQAGMRQAVARVVDQKHGLDGGRKRRAASLSGGSQDGVGAAEKLKQELNYSENGFSAAELFSDGADAKWGSAWFRDIDKRFSIYGNAGGGVAMDSAQVARVLFEGMSSGSDGYRLIAGLKETLANGTDLPAGVDKVIALVEAKQRAWDADNTALASLYSLGRFSYGAVSTVFAPLYRGAANIAVGGTGYLTGEQIGDYSLSNLVAPIVATAGYGYDVATGERSALSDARIVISSAKTAASGYYGEFSSDWSSGGLGYALTSRAGDLGAVFGTAASLAYGGGEVALFGRASRVDDLVAVERAVPNGNFYSVAFETKLSPTSYPNVSRGRHFQEASEALLKAMEGDVAFAKSMNDMGVILERTPRGFSPRTSPDNWTWHHAQEPGVMQLVPRAQHQPGSIFQNALHPDGRGGYSIWGK